MIFKPAILAALAAAITLASAHPGEKIDKREAVKEAHIRHTIAAVNKRALEECSGAEHVKQRKQQAMERRLETFKRLRAERGIEDQPYLHRRDTLSFSKWNQVNHDQTGKLKYNKGTPSASIFGANTSCVLTPDNADGPYFVEGELLRSNIVEDVVGVPIHLEIQFVDVTNCKPATDLLIDVWACNATGAYSGVSAAGEGGLKTTYLRGVQPTDKDGVVNFDSIFPGHYQGRATHQHIIAHVGSQLTSNGTYTGGHIAHLSQFFFDQSLLSLIESSAPYNTNKIPKTSNLQDGFTGYAATAVYDPFPEYIMLGNDLSHGLFIWAEVALNKSANYDAYAPYTAWLGKDGGADNPYFPYLEIITAFPPPSHG